MGQSRDSDLAPLRPAGALACIGKGTRKSPLIRPTGFARRSVSRPAGALTCIRRGARKSPLIRPAGFARRSVPNLSGPRFHRRVGLCLFGHNPTFRPEACRGPHLHQKGARNSPWIRPAGFARPSVPNPVGGPHLYQKGGPEVTFDPSRRICSAFRPEACRGSHLYRQGRPEVAFDPSRRFCSAFRPAGGVPGVPSPHL